VTSWMPIYADGAVTGWTLDFMRRHEDALPGVTEFLIASAALRFQEEGAALLSLSGVPLARLDRGERPDALQRLLDQISRALEPVYGFRSLLAFKAKFQPEFRPLHLTYPDPTALPAIGTAIARAHLPDLDAATALTLVRKLMRTRPTRM
jgi:phosphatidylglycerol lysyltransferase